jgi:hypothetical protein
MQWKSNEYYTTLVCVFVALGIQRAMSMRHIFIGDLPSSTIFFNIISQKHDFRKKKNIEHIMCVLIISTTSIRNISNSKKKWARYD